MLITVFISFIASIFIALQDPIIQKFTIRIAGGYISAKTGTDIQIGRLYISPNFTIHIDQFLVKDLKDNNLLKVEQLKVRPVMQDIIQGNIHVGRVELTNAEANLITFEDSTSMNFQFLIDAFSSGEKEKSDKTTTVTVDRILLKNLNFQFWDQNKDDPEKDEKHLMDYAHLVVENINLDLENLLIIDDSITGTIHHLAATEKSGFNLKYLESEVNVSQSGILLDNLNLETSNSSLHLDLHMLYNGFQAFNSFIDSVYFDSPIYPSNILLSDLGPFAETLYEMTDPIRFEGWMKGPVKGFRMNGLKFGIGNHTAFDGSLTIEPLNIMGGQQALNIKKLNFSYDDLANFHIPGSSGTIPLPEMLKPLGKGTIKGYFSGSSKKFKANIEATTDVGNVAVTLNKQTSDQHYDIFDGEVQATRLNIGELVNISNIVGTLDLSANVIGRLSPSGDMDLDIDGNIMDVMLLGNSVNEITLNGNLHKNRFNGKISVDDEKLDMDFKGMFDFSNPKALGGNFHADIASADLHKLNIVKNDNTSLISGSITADGNNFNDFNKAEGTLSINNFSFTNSSGTLDMRALNASIVNDNLLQKRIQAQCDFFDFEMAGKMDFTTLVTAFKQYVYSYVEIPQWTAELEKFEESKKSSDQDFVINLNINDPKPITNMFMPNINIAKNTSLSGTFTSRSRLLNLTLRSKYVNINNIKIKNIECKNFSSPRRSITRLNVDKIILRDTTDSNPNAISLDAFSILASLQNDSIKTRISWDDSNSGIVSHNKANISTSFVPLETGGRFCIENANILLNDSIWTINPNNAVIIEDSKVRISNLELMSNHQSLMVDGFTPMNQEDTLAVKLNQFDLSTLDFLFNGFFVDGFVTGNATVSNLNNDPTIFADLGIRDLGLNGETYGDAAILSQWNNEDKSINMDVKLTDKKHEVVSLLGSFYTDKQKDNLDFKLNIDSLNLSILSPFISSFAQRVQGLCHGSFDIKGSLNEPDIQGQLKVHDGGCKVNLLNTFYTFSPTIVLTDKKITLNYLKLTDTLGNSALVNGHIEHNHLKDMVLDLKLYPKNFLAMATTASPSTSYYGTAVASGIVKIQGPLNHIDIDIKAITQKGTVITLPLGNNSGVKKHDFITFVDRSIKKVNEEGEAIENEPSKEKKSTNLSIKLDVDVNNEAQIKISLPNSLGSMEAKGDGNIKLGVGYDNSLSLIGDYVIGSGSLMLNIKDVIRRNFSLEPGSNISWTGDPVNGTINATGVYQTKAAISSLGLIDSTNMNSNVKVECLVHLKNKLLNPDISFGFRLPNASEDLNQAVFYVIDTTNQAEMLTQTIYLLAFNSFDYGGTSSNYYGLITSQLNDIISQFTNNIDINVNYKPGSELSNEEMTVAMKKQLFNDRLTIETNFGVIIPSSTYASSSTNIVGDFNLDYKITKDGRLSAQMFNRSNYNTTYYQYTYYKMAPYTQGIGLSYSKSFDRFKDLFKKRTNNIDLPNRPMIARPGTRPGARPNTPKPNDNEPSD